MAFKFPRFNQLRAPHGTAPGSYEVSVDADKKMSLTAPGSSSSWNNIVSNALSALTGFTVGTGTWAIVSGVINQASTTATVRRLHMDTKVPLAECIVEVDVKMNTSPSNVSSRVGISIGTPRAADTANAHVIALITSGSTTHLTGVNFEQDATSNYGTILFSTASIATIANGTWVRFRVHKVGHHYSIWVDGVYFCSFIMGSTVASSNVLSREMSRIALWTYEANADFRNLDVWVPVMP